MSFSEYNYIKNLSLFKRMLVFGCGYDSHLWRTISNKIHFLEHNDKWITNNNDTTKITYTSKISQTKELLSNMKHDDLYIKGLDSVLSQKWDVILVDSPEGWNNTHHGRIQSIFMANLIADNHTHILVHDIDRETEKSCVNEILGTKVAVIDKLGHYMKRYA